MREIREVEFAIDELVLYLDAYPDCAQALAMYHELLERRNGLAAAWESRFGPLTRLGNESRTTWDWTAGPFPWEPEANE